MPNKRPTFEHACAKYVHRYTMEHVPAWASKPLPNGKYAPPQYRTDGEWFANTVFPGEPDHEGPRSFCNSRNASWPLGMKDGKPVLLDHPFNPGG